MAFCSMGGYSGGRCCAIFLSAKRAFHSRDDLAFCRSFRFNIFLISFGSSRCLIPPAWGIGGRGFVFGAGLSGGRRGGGFLRGWSLRPNRARVGVRACVRARARVSCVCVMCDGEVRACVLCARARARACSV